MNKKMSILGRMGGVWGRRKRCFPGDSMVHGKLEMRNPLCEFLISSFPWTMLSHLMGQLQLLWRLVETCGDLWRPVETCGEPPGASRSIQEHPEASTSLHKSPQASTSLHKPPQASTSLHKRIAQRPSERRCAQWGAGQRAPGGTDSLLGTPPVLIPPVLTWTQTGSPNRVPKQGPQTGTSNSVLKQGPKTGPNH